MDVCLRARWGTCLFKGRSRVNAIRRAPACSSLVPAGARTASVNDGARSARHAVPAFGTQLRCRAPFHRLRSVELSVPEPATSTRAPLPLLDPKKTYSHVSPGVCDSCAADAGTRQAWVDLLVGQLPSHRAQAKRTMEFLDAGEGYMTNYWLWEEDYVEYLEKAVIGPPTGPGATLLDMVEDKERLLRNRELHDLFAGMKAHENKVILPLYHEVAASLDAISGGQDERFQTVLEVALAGNLFDAGSAAAVQNIAFCDEKDCDVPEGEQKRFSLDAKQLHDTFLKAQSKVGRPDGGWRFDDFKALAQRAQQDPWKSALVFCDNAGADTMGATLLARHLASIQGPDSAVALVANDTAALNDITHAELEAFVAAAAEEDPVLRGHVEAGRVVCLPSGQASTLLNMEACGPELNAWVEAQGTPPGQWLVVMDGMGRSLESNWEAAKYMLEDVDVLNLAMVKSEINALRLDAEVYDCVVRLNTGGQC